MWRIAYRNLLLRPIRTLLTIAGLAVSVAVLLSISALGRAYQSGLRTELDRMGLQMMLVPLGCPYDAAARVLKGRTLENSLPESALEQAANDPAVAVAAPMLMVATPRPEQGRTDMWVGLDESARKLKPWWHAPSGRDWFEGEDSVILGADAAEVEMRSPGDRFFSPETGRQMRVAGVLTRSGTSDDSMFFVPLKSAQKMFEQPGRLTAIGIRLKDPTMLREAASRLQTVPGTQVVTMTEMMGTFLNLLGAVRTLLLSVAVVALAVSILSVFNTLLGAVVERTNEFCLMRAIGASQSQLLRMILTESLLVSVIGCLLGILVAGLAGQGIEKLVQGFLPLAPNGPMFSLNSGMVAASAGIALAVGLIAGIYPALRACRMQPAEATGLE